MEAEPCPAGERWEEKTEIEAKLVSGKKAVFEAGKINEKTSEFEQVYKIECNESVATGKTTNAGGGAKVLVGPGNSGAAGKAGGVLHALPPVAYWNAEYEAVKPTAMWLTNE